MIVTYTTKPGQKPTPEQIKEVQEASKHPIVFDEDCPESSPEMLKALRCAARNKNRRNSE